MRKCWKQKEVEKTGWIKRNGEDGKEQTKRNGGHLERTLELQLKNYCKWIFGRKSWFRCRRERANTRWARPNASVFLSAEVFVRRKKRGLETRFFNSVQRHVCLKEFKEFRPRVFRDVIWGWWTRLFRQRFRSRKSSSAKRLFREKFRSFVSMT